MNSTEQRTHSKRTEELDARLATVEVVLDAAVKAIGDERTHRIALAHEQRAYVDGADRQLRERCQERWDETGKTTKRLADRHFTFTAMTFWQRLRWLLLGY